MSKIHYFQRYHQKENVVTNNTMLLFSRLYHHSPKKFEMFLQSILDPSIELKIGVNFGQQEKSSDSVPDGIIEQHSFKIAIETKLGNAFGDNQLLNHLKCFGTESTKILIALSSLPMQEKQKENLKHKIEKFNSDTGFNVAFAALTFNDILNSFREQLNDFDIELHDIIEDYNRFCDSAGLLPRDHPRLLIVPCGDSIKDNFQYKMYYAPATRTHSRATHMGIYNNKKVKGIGKIENIVVADYDEETNSLHVISEEKPSTENQKERIIAIIKASFQTLGWSINKGHQFFCLDDLEKTSFVKETKGGIMGKRYENLEQITGLGKDTLTVDFANVLLDKTWK